VQRNVLTGGYGFYTPSSPNAFTANAGAGLSALDRSVLGTDGSVTGDRTVLGNTNPTWFGGISNSFAYKGFDLEVFVRFSGGNKVMNATRQESLLNYSFHNNGREILRRWTPQNTDTDVPRIALGSATNTNFNGQAITRFVESADFVRIQNISLGYTVPKSVFSRTSKFPVSSLRLFAQVQNAFTFTRYTGLDPELASTLGTGSSQDLNGQVGVDYNANPQIRYINFGLNASF
jgi:TonB-dependent starch-binding outer membrane protein SusC